MSNEYTPLIGLGIFVFFVGGIGLLAKWAGEAKLKHEREERRKAAEK
jgi:hypothetical protein